MPAVSAIVDNLDYELETVYQDLAAMAANSQKTLLEKTEDFIFGPRGLWIGDDNNDDGGPVRPV
eukprot:2049908-Pyramimonas_sp.AAC.1